MNMLGKQEMSTANRSAHFFVPGMEYWQLSAKGSGNALAQSIPTASVNTVAELRVAVKKRGLKTNSVRRIDSLYQRDVREAVPYGGTNQLLLSA